MPSNIICNPARSDDAFKAQQKLQFDRWRTAIAIVERMREAGLIANFLMIAKTATDGCIELLDPPFTIIRRYCACPSGPSCKTGGPGKAREPSLYDHLRSSH